MTDREIFVAALHLPDPAERRAFLDRACGDDAGARARIELLLAENDRLGSFLESPAAPLLVMGAFGPTEASTTVADPPSGEPIPVEADPLPSRSRNRLRASAARARLRALVADDRRLTRLAAGLLSGRG